MTFNGVIKQIAPNAHIVAIYTMVKDMLQISNNQISLGKRKSFALDLWTKLLYYCY